MFNKFFFLSIGGVALAGTGTGLGVYYGIGDNSKLSDKPKDSEEDGKPGESLSGDRSNHTHQPSQETAAAQQPQEPSPAQAT